MPRRQRKSESYRDLLLTEIFPKMKKKADGSYDLEQVEEKLIPYLEPISLDQINHRRVMDIIKNLCDGDPSTRIEEKVDWGFFRSPGGVIIPVNPNRFVVNNRGGIVPYMEARTEDRYDEIARKEKHKNAVVAAWRVDEADREVLQSWQRQKRLQRWQPHQMDMTAFHAEYPLQHHSDAKEA